MHALWKGSLSFGLVNIPVSLFSAAAQRELKFKMLHKKDLSEIRYARMCKEEEKEVPWEDIVKGYEQPNGAYVVLTDEDFEKANLEKTRSIEILDFTKETQIDTIYYDTPYYLIPDKNAGNAYALLLEALKSSKKVAIGRFVFHNHEHIGVIRPYQNILILQQLRYHSELKSLKEFSIPHPRLSKAEQTMALQLIDKLTKPFKPEKYSDTYIDEVKAIIKKKGKGEKLPTRAVKKSRKVESMITLLEKSLKKPTKKRKRAA